MDYAGKSKAYQKAKHQIFFAGLALDGILLIVFFTSGLSTGLRDLSSGISPQTAILNGVYIMVLSLGAHLIHFPLRWFRGFIWEHKFQLSNQKFMTWLIDDVKQGFVSLIVTLVALEGIYMLLGRFPKTWWFWAGVFWLLLNLGLARLTPNVLIPFFYKYSPISNEALRSSVLKLFRQSRIAVKDAYLINFSSKTKKANAFICGLGKSRRVVLSDTLASEFSVEEIETVIAHEIGHYKHHDIFKFTIVHSAVVFLGFFFVDRFLADAMRIFGFSKIDDIAFFPVIALAFIVLGFFVMPFLNGYSRMLEVEADRFSLHLTQKPKDFISMIRKLGTMNLSDFEPDRLMEMFFYTHPPISKRIRFAETFLAKFP